MLVVFTVFIDLLSFNLNVVFMLRRDASGQLPQLRQCWL